jgi:hypothetical protein
LFSLLLLMLVLVSLLFLLLVVVVDGSTCCTNDGGGCHGRLGDPYLSPTGARSRAPCTSHHYTLQVGTPCQTEGRLVGQALEWLPQET